MGILDIIGEFFATEELPELECKHDWEQINGNQNSAEYYTLRTCNLSVKDGRTVIDKKEYDDEHYFSGWMESRALKYRPLEQKVCLKCGECVDEITDYVERRKEERRKAELAMEARAKRIKQRQTLALKLWKECHNDVSGDSNPMHRRLR